MVMRWHELLFMHWPVDFAQLRPFVPPSLEIEKYDGSAWLGVVPFRMSGTRPRFLPAVPGLSDFPELNVRTYVTANGKPGVWFFSLDAANRIAVEVARRTYHLNYCHARMRCERTEDRVSYQSDRIHRGMPPATFEAEYCPTGEARRSTPGSLEFFLTERYCLYAARPTGPTYRGEITHSPWELRPAEADVRANTMSRQLGFELPDVQPLLHYGGSQHVLAWKPYAI